MRAVPGGSDVFCGGGDTAGGTVKTWKAALPCPGDLGWWWWWWLWVCEGDVGHKPLVPFKSILFL